MAGVGTRQIVGQRPAASNTGSANSVNIGRPKVTESAWQAGLRQQMPKPAAAAPMTTLAPPEAPAAPGPKPIIGPGLQFTPEAEPMDPMQAPVPPPEMPQALEGLRAAIGNPGGEQFGAQSPPAPVGPGMGRRIYPQGGIALAQRAPRVY